MHSAPLWLQGIMNMTKADLLKLLEPFTDDIRIVLTSLEDTEAYYHLDGLEGVIVIQGENETP